jgi:hypothetical protein
VTRESVPRTRRMLFGEVDVSAVIKHVPSCLSTVRRPSCRMSADRPRDARSPASATNHVAPGEASVIAQKDAGGRPRRNNALNADVRASRDVTSAVRIVRVRRVH